MHPDTALDLPTAASHAGLSVATLRRWIREGKLTTLTTKPTTVRYGTLDRAIRQAHAARNVSRRALDTCTH